jgi:PST family polysaccharide transporter
VAERAEHGVGARTLRGMAWAYSSYVGGRLLVLLSTAILARLLVPAEFGIVALALTMMALLEGLADLGLSQALVIQPKEVLHERAETVFVSSVALGLAMTIVVAALSPVVAMFFDEPELTAIAAVLSLNFLLRSLGATHYALAQKALDFRARTGAELAGVVARGVVGIGLALAGFGAWSLVLGYLIGTLVFDAAIWAMVRWRPKLEPRRAHLRSMIGFGGTLTAVNVVAALISNADYVFIGRALGTTALGLYTLGFRLPELLVINLSVVAGRVLFPAFTAVDYDALGRAYLLAFRYTAMISLPLSAGLAVLAEPLVLVAFGDQWLDAVTVMQILAVYALAITIGIPAGAAYKATGRAGVLLKLGLARLILLLIALFLFVDLGIDAVAACQAALAGAFSIVGIWLAGHLLDVGPRRILSELWPLIAATLPMVAAVAAVDYAIETPVLALLAGTAVGAIVYLGALWLLRPQWIRYLYGRLRARPRPDAEDEQPPPAELREARETDVIA